MSSNRLIYDSCAYTTTIKSSTDPLNYLLFSVKYKNSILCDKGCANELSFTERTNAENELNGLARRHSLCPVNKYNPSSNVYNPPLFIPNIMCEKIHCLTPSNLKKPTSNMINIKT